MGLTHSWLRSVLLPAYYYASLPGRQVASHVAATLGRHPLMVLFYHRVADRHPTPWTISNRDFQRQMEWLLAHFELISLAECQSRIAAGRNHGPAVCVTFDDGYAENCEEAIPWLISRRIPCTYFVSSDFVLRNQPFPHDVASGQPLPPNTVAQLRSLVAAGIDIGAHTRSHRDLGPVQEHAILLDEIAGSRNDLQQALGCAVRYFAFPYGQRVNLNAAALQLARESGLSGVCSAYGGYNLPGTDPFHLLRLHGDPNFLRFRNWLTLDPRQVSGEILSRKLPPATHPLP